MKVSVITPSHRPDWLGRAYASLQAQTHTDWEWVLLLNGPAASAPGEALGDPRVRVSAVPGAPGIGALKRHAFGLAAGELLVELDHDDELAPEALAMLAETATVEPGGFYYSDFAERQEDGTDRVLPSYLSAGWEAYDADVGGRPHRALRAFPPSARALASIEFTPNHVRAWAHSAYIAAGRHDPALPVADDYDLVTRTYLAGVPFVHVPRCLYVQHLREDGTNTHRARGGEIWEHVRGMIGQRTIPLVAEWCRRAGLIAYAAGAITAPAVFEPAALVAGGTRISPARDDGGDGAGRLVGCFLLGEDVLPRVPQGPALVAFWNDLYRRLAPGGWVIADAPSALGQGGVADPLGVSLWSQGSFRYLTEPVLAARVPGLDAKFQAVRLFDYHPSRWHEDIGRLLVRAELCAVKGQRQPGWHPWKASV